MLYWFISTVAACLIFGALIAGKVIDYFTKED